MDPDLVAHLGPRWATSGIGFVDFVGHAVEVVRSRVTVWGRVQGVWYRETCRRIAEANAVAGWVRNREDGTVEAVLEGEATAVERVIGWMRTGPPRAHVRQVELRAETPKGEAGFSVR